MFMFIAHCSKSSKSCWFSILLTFMWGALCGSWCRPIYTSRLIFYFSQYGIIFVTRVFDARRSESHPNRKSCALSIADRWKLSLQREQEKKNGCCRSVFFRVCWVMCCVWRHKANGTTKNSLRTNTDGGHSGWRMELGITHIHKRKS